MLSSISCYKICMWGIQDNKIQSGRFSDFKREREREKDGKAGPAESKKSSEKSQAWKTRLTLYIGMYGNIPYSIPDPV